MNTPSIRRAFALTALAAALAVNLGAAQASEAASTVSALSALSALPIALSVAAPVLILSAGASLVLTSVSVTVAGTVWVLERVSDGAKAVVTLSVSGAGALSVAAGTAVVVTAVSTGWVLSDASTAIAFLPNEIGASLLYNEQVTR